MKPPKILSIWQPIGYSTHIISKQVSIKYGVKTAHTGTLDPMAEGVIIILLGDGRFKKYEYAKWKKTYEFEVILGISTDSYDGLGLISNTQKVKKDFSKVQIKKALSKLKGRYEQTVPSYAAIKIKGKSLHWYSRNDQLKKIVLPKRSGEIYKIELISHKTLSREKIVQNLLKKINKINGDFRQQEITNNWQDLIKNSKISKTKHQVLKIRVETSKGIYVRSLSQDIANNLGTIGFVYSLTRTKNGKYSKKSAKTTESLKLKW